MCVHICAYVCVPGSPVGIINVIVCHLPREMKKRTTTIEKDTHPKEKRSMNSTIIAPFIIQHVIWPGLVGLGKLGCCLLTPSHSLSFSLSISISLSLQLLQWSHIVMHCHPKEKKKNRHFLAILARKICVCVVLSVTGKK